MTSYYADKLSAVRLKHAYDLAPPRIRQYLDAEVEFVADRFDSADAVVELGCGYGRVLQRFCSAAGFVVGIDSSLESLELGWELCRDRANLAFACMDAVDTGFETGSFDVVACIQNGISAFHVDRRRLIAESVRIAVPGGLVLFSSYSDKFWEHRLDWFERQAAAGLLGEIDRRKTGNGMIVCRDGFTATTVDRAEFEALTGVLGLRSTITEVDSSSVFCEIVVPAEPRFPVSSEGMHHD
jgi:SAM-dependent methyltransferase